MSSEVKGVNVDELVDFLNPNRSPEQLKEQFSFQLKMLEMSIDELATQLQRLGDYRKLATINRGLHRMATGETVVTGEILVILRLLGRQHQKKKDFKLQLDWKPFPDGSWSAMTEDFAIALQPKTRGRWLVNLTHRESGYSPPWPCWQTNLDHAKQKAVERLYEARLELEDWAYDEKLKETAESAPTA